MHNDKHNNVSGGKTHQHFRGSPKVDSPKNDDDHLSQPSNMTTVLRPQIHSPNDALT